MKLSFVRKKAAGKTEEKPTLVMREIYADALPDGIVGDLEVLKRSLVNAEKVHPFTGADEAAKVRQLEQCRLAKKTAEGLQDKHCYGLFEQETGKLRTVVYVQLRDIEKEEGKDVLDRQLPGNIWQTLTRAGAAISRADTAIFYSISTLGEGKKQKETAQTQATTTPSVDSKQRKAAVKLVAQAIKQAVKNGDFAEGSMSAEALTTEQLSDGEQLIRAVAGHVKERYGIKAFSTLSPMRSGKEPAKLTGFASWLKDKLSAKNHGLLTSQEQAFLTEFAQSIGHEASDFEKIQHLHQKRAALDEEHQRTFTRLMEDLGTYYIAYERNTQKPDWPLDSVTKFHIGNGAKLARIHYLPADKSTELDSAGAFGMMANYRYEPEMLVKRKQIARAEDTVPLTPSLAKRYIARLQSLGKPFKKGNRSATPTYVVGVPGTDHHLVLSANESPHAAAGSWRALVNQSTIGQGIDTGEHAR